VVACGQYADNDGLMNRSLVRDVRL